MFDSPRPTRAGCGNRTLTELRWLSRSLPMDREEARGRRVVRARRTPRWARVRSCGVPRRFGPPRSPRSSVDQGLVEGLSSFPNGGLCEMARTMRKKWPVSKGRTRSRSPWLGVLLLARRADPQDHGRSQPDEQGAEIPLIGARVGRRMEKNGACVESLRASLLRCRRWHRGSDPSGASDPPHPCRRRGGAGGDGHLVRCDVREVGSPVGATGGDGRSRAVICDLGS